MKPKLSLKGRAMQLLAQRDQSRVELRHKLTRHAAAQIAACPPRGECAKPPGPNAAEPNADRDLADDEAAIAGRVDELLDWLEANRFSSDARFVESRVQARLARFGNLRIRDELARHGVAPGGELAQRLEDSELQRALAVWSARFGVAPQDAAAHARQYRFLAGRGFSAESIRQTLRRAPRLVSEHTAESRSERRVD